MQYCPSCGNVISENDNYCPNCGKSLNDDNTNHKYAYRQDSVESEYIPNPEVVCDKDAKSKLIAGLLQILLPFGIGRFYLKYTSMAVAQLILTFFGIGALWTFIDGIYILLDGVKKDGEGKDLKNV